MGLNLFSEGPALSAVAIVTDNKMIQVIHEIIPLETRSQLRKEFFNKEAEPLTFGNLRVCK